jgi:excisionase family DNA binding protein
VNVAHNEEERLTVGEAAKELGISEKTVRGLIRKGDLPAYRPTPRKTWVLRGDLAAFWASRRIAPTDAIEEVGRRTE